MTLSPEQFRERMVDYLYGELDAEALREFEASLTESESYRRELDALQRTLGSTRELLASALSEEPPSGPRERALAAATAAVAAQKSGATLEHVRSRRQPSRAVRMLRTPWLYPAVGIAAAIAIVVIRDQRERSAQEELERPFAAQTESAPVASPSTAAPGGRTDHVVAQGSDDAVSEREARAAAGGASEPERARLRSRRGPARDFAQPPPRVGKHKAEAAEELAKAETAEDRAEAEGVALGSEAKRATDGKGRGAGGLGELATRTGSTPAAARSRADDLRESAPGDSVGRPLSEVSAAAPSAPSAAAPSAPSAEAPSAPAAPSTTSAASSGARPSAAQKSASAERSFAAPPPSAAPASADRTPVAAGAAAREEASAPAKTSARDDGEQRARDELAARAASYAEKGRYAEARSLYRSLLRRFPADPQRQRWQRALADCERALRSDSGPQR